MRSTSRPIAWALLTHRIIRPHSIYRHIVTISFQTTVIDIIEWDLTIALLCEHSLLNLRRLFFLNSTIDRWGSLHVLGPACLSCTRRRLIEYQSWTKLFEVHGLAFRAFPVEEIARDKTAESGRCWPRLLQGRLPRLWSFGRIGARFPTKWLEWRCELETWLFRHYLFISF